MEKNVFITLMISSLEIPSNKILGNLLKLYFPSFCRQIYIATVRGPFGCLNKICDVMKISLNMQDLMIFAALVYIAVVCIVSHLNLYWFA